MFTVYVKKACPFCQKLLAILNERKILYDLVDISKYNDVAENLVQKDGHTPVPQVDIKGRIIYDYTTEEALVDEIESLSED
ncbi:hypothetical protein COU54_01505 [Candidatus Pacearchaeota archaeon CG10_big_fil_rev_8_21_14_0_10_31_24]|nr:MAG: hypothetical protein COU54_01505 [Candidatus Pacearchaeota archaeon CG10_big_fil_rev_8_21_14_0_10_31_24]